MDASSTLLDEKSQPRLPVELERIIFDMTAFPSDVPLAESRTRAAGLMLVAKRVREWRVSVVLPAMTNHANAFVQDSPKVVLGLCAGSSQGLFRARSEFSAEYHEQRSCLHGKR